MLRTYGYIGFQTKRILSHPLKLAIVVAIILFPFIDFMQNLLVFLKFENVNAWKPELETFLTYRSSGTFPAHKLLFWFLPLYYLILLGDSCIEDAQYGYRNIIISRNGRKRYFGFNLAYSFGCAFLVMFLALAFNAGLCAVAFRGGQHLPELSFEWQKEMFIHLQRTLWTYIVFVSLISGVVAAGATALSVGLHNRYVVYPLVYIMWYIPFVMDRSIMLALQPFCEYRIADARMAVLLVLAFNVIAVLVGAALYYSEWNDFLKMRKVRACKNAQKA